MNCEIIKGNITHKILIIIIENKDKLEKRMLEDNDINKKFKVIIKNSDSDNKLIISLI